MATNRKTQNHCVYFVLDNDTGVLLYVIVQNNTGNCDDVQV